MKKTPLLLLWAFLLLSATLRAQNNDSIGPQGLIDTLFSGLSRAHITTGLLADKTVSVYVPLDQYNGSSAQYISFDQILTLPPVLQNMCTGSLKIPDETQIRKSYAQHNRQHLVVPLVIDYEYNSISDSAFVDGLIDTTGVFWTDTVINGISAFETHQLKATALNYDLLPGNDFKFMYDPNLYLTNKPLPNSVFIDFGDGLGIRPVSRYDTLSIHYLNDGEHDITVYGQDPGANELSTLGKYKVTTKTLASNDDYTDCRFMFNSNQVVFKYENRLGITGYDNSGNPIMGNLNVPIYMQAMISIQMGRDKANGTKHTCLKKPLIFVDGINFGYTNHMDEFFQWGNKCNELGFENIAKAIDFNPITGVSSVDARFINGPDFIKKATDAGYDIIFFDMLYGAANIKLNGLLLEEFIVKMNNGSLQGGSCYCGKTYDEIVVIGPSMGGQVSRYALLDMEQNGINNCVREWVSFDSPNQGANISLGLQQFVEWSALNNKKAFGLFNSSKNILDQKLDRDAAKQLLIYHYTEKNKSKANPAFYDFYNDLQEKGGLPRKCRKVAIANGSLTGAQQDLGTARGAYGGGALLAELNLPFNRFSKLSYSFYAKLYATEGATLTKAPCSFDNKNKYVFSASREYHLINKYIPIGNVSCDFVKFDGWGFDYAPGGTNKSILSLDISMPLTNVLIFTPGITYHDNFGFIPTVSSLAIYPNVWVNNGGVNYQVLNNFGVANIEKHQPNYAITPFDAIYGPYTNQLNEEHVFISQGLVKWAIDELQMGDYESTLSAGSKAGNTYNFGNHHFDRLKSITVNATCSLKVFANEARGYKNRAAGYEEQYYASLTAPDDQAIFELYTVENCDPTRVKIMTDGVFELGDGQTRKTNTHFKKGSTLELMAGATLHILDGSTLVIEKGATLIYHKGAKIVLDGPNAVLQIIGTVSLPDAGTQFTFTHHPSLNNGFIDFVNSPSINTNGNSNTMVINGNSMAQKIVRISGGDLNINGIFRNSKSAFASIILSNGIVELDKNSSFKTDAAISCNKVSFKGKGSQYRGNGLETFGQDNILVSYCRFENLSTGFLVQNAMSSSNVIVVEHNLFSNCMIGASFLMMPTNLNQNNFTHCTTGLNIDYCPKFKMLNSTFSNNNTGLSYQGNNGLSGVVKTCSFKLNYYAIRQNGNNNSLTLACCDIRNCTTAVYAEGRINMSKNFTDKDYGIAGGDCNFSDHQTFIEMNYGDIELANGNNNFIQGNPMIPVRYLQGIIDRRSATGIFVPNMVNVQNNYWSPSPANNASYYNFVILTPTLMYPGILFTGTPINNAYGNCYLQTTGAGGPGDVIVGDGVAGDGMANAMVFNGGGKGTNESNTISLYPVPTGAILNVFIPGILNEEILNIQITSIQGTQYEIAPSFIAPGVLRFNTELLANGTYFITIKTNSNTYRKEFVVIHP